MSEFSPGGVIRGEGTFRAALAPDECVRNLASQCIRHDGVHGWESIEVSTLNGQTVRVGSACQHLPCHVVSVESVVDGTQVARLCTNCDEQLL